MARPFYYGGQAIIEGVMMRGQNSMAMAIRCPDGGLKVVSRPLSALYKGRFRGTPLGRGFIALAEALLLGIQALLYSADISIGEEGESIPSGALWGTVALSFAFGIGLFFVAPLLITRYFFDPYLDSSLVSNLAEGVLRILIFVAYLKAIGLMPDIRKVFAYHGAEHTVVNAYEDGAPLELEAVRDYSTAHVRCGTSLLLIVLVIAIFVFAFLGQPPLWLGILSRIVLIPLIFVFSYELVRLGANHIKNGLIHTLLMPGLALQALTTHKPDDSQLEVALSALKEVLEADRA